MVQNIKKDRNSVNRNGAIILDNIKRTLMLSNLYDDECGNDVKIQIIKCLIYRILHEIKDIDEELRHNIITAFKHTCNVSSVYNIQHFLWDSLDKNLYNNIVCDYIMSPNEIFPYISLFNNSKDWNQIKDETISRIEEYGPKLKILVNKVIQMYCKILHKMFEAAIYDICIRNLHRLINSQQISFRDVYDAPIYLLSFNDYGIEKMIMFNISSLYRLLILMFYGLLYHSDQLMKNTLLHNMFNYMDEGFTFVATLRKSTNECNICNSHYKYIVPIMVTNSGLIITLSDPFYSICVNKFNSYRYTKEVINNRHANLNTVAYAPHIISSPLTFEDFHGMGINIMIHLYDYCIGNVMTDNQFNLYIDTSSLNGLKNYIHILFPKVDIPIESRSLKSTIIKEMPIIHHKHSIDNLITQVNYYLFNKDSDKITYNIMNPISSIPFI